MNIKFILMSFLVLTSINIAMAHNHDPRFSQIEQLMKSTRTTMSIPGIAVAVIEHDKLAWMGADGYADLENNIAASSKTIWRLGSVSKPIAATSIMQLVEMQKIKLNEPIWTYLPWYPRKDNNIITVLNLLTHTSGIRHYHYELGEKENMRSFATVEEGSKIYGVDREPLQFRPGTRYLYSTFAYALLAGIVENASNLSFEAYLKENIFLPAGMLTARLDKPSDIIPNRAHFYRKNRDKNTIINAPYVDVSYKWAAGGLVASVEDLGHYIIALHEGRLLSHNILSLIYTPNLLLDGTATDYGIGWHIETTQHNHSWIYHNGSATGGSAFVLHSPSDGLAIIILCNLENINDLKKIAKDMAHIINPDSK